MIDPKIRAFVALEVEEAMRARLAEAALELRPAAPLARFVRPEGIHITLRFLGSSPLDQLEEMKPALAAAAACCAPLLARVSGAGMFPERGAPRVLWLGLSVPSDLGRLQAACECAARAAGFEPERRAFRPHLSVARFRERVARPTLPQLDLGETSFRKLVLFRSELVSDGARHTPLATFVLAGRS